MTSTHRSQQFLPSFAAAFLLLAYVSDESRATVVSFTDRPSFEAAIQGSTLFDFEGLGTGSLGNEVVFGDATIVSTNNSGVFAVEVGEFGAPTGQIATLNSGSLRIDLAPGYKAIGMDIGGILASGFASSFTLSFDLQGTSGSLLSGNIVGVENDDLGTANTTFFGYTSTTEISSLELTVLSPAGSAFEAIDNLIIGNPIPEPASLTYIAGFSILGLLRYGRLRKRG